MSSENRVKTSEGGLLGIACIFDISLKLMVACIFDISLKLMVATLRVIMIHPIQPILLPVNQAQGICGLSAGHCLAAVGC